MYTHRREAQVRSHGLAALLYAARMNENRVNIYGTRGGRRRRMRIAPFVTPVYDAITTVLTRLAAPRWRLRSEGSDRLSEE